MSLRDNASVTTLAARHPDRFVPFARADIVAGGSAMDEFERWVCEHGFRGLSLRPFMIGRPATDPRLFRLLRQVRRTRCSPFDPHLGQLGLERDPAISRDPHHIDEAWPVASLNSPA